MNSTTEDKPFDSKAFLKNLTSRPGVYRMYDATDQVIYVGKARNLKKRVSSYFQKRDSSPKTRALVSNIRRIEVTVTHTENEALILENTLIKAHRPRYNILLRDDKSYPYIFLSDDPFPSLSFHRGRRGKQGRYFGPYPSATAVRIALRNHGESHDSCARRRSCRVVLRTSEAGTSGGAGNSSPASR